MVTGFGAGAFQPMANALVDALQASGADVLRQGPALVWQRLSGVEQYHLLLSDAGMVEVQVETEQLGYHLNGPDDWWDVVWNSDFRALVERLPAAEAGRIRVACQESVRELTTQDGIWMDVTTLFAAGVKSGQGGGESLLR